MERFLVEVEELKWVASQTYRIVFVTKTRDSFLTYCLLGVDRNKQVECWMNDDEITAGQEFLLKN